MGILTQPKVQKIIIRECGEPLIELDSSEFRLDPIYYKWKFSDTDKIRLRSGAVEKLRYARKLLPIGWNFKIWDGFRTLATQKLLYDDYWKKLREKHPHWSEEELDSAVEVFVSRASHDKNLPAPHNTGGAIDLTIVDESGQDLPMGTYCDEFNSKSFTNYFAEGRNHTDRLFHKNRMLLKEILSQAGFANYKEEWWHYSYGDQMWAAEQEADYAIYGSCELT